MNNGEYICSRQTITCWALCVFKPDQSLSSTKWSMTKKKKRRERKKKDDRTERKRKRSPPPRPRFAVSCLSALICSLILALFHSRTRSPSSSSIPILALDYGSCSSPYLCATVTALPFVCVYGCVALCLCFCVCALCVCVCSPVLSPPAPSDSILAPAFLLFLPTVYSAPCFPFSLSIALSATVAVTVTVCFSLCLFLSPYFSPLSAYLAVALALSPSLSQEALLLFPHELTDQPLCPRRESPAEACMLL